MAFLGFNRNNRNCDCPCNGCEPPKRHVGCKSDCPEWEPWLKVKEARDKAEREREAGTIISDSKRKEIWRRQRYCRQSKTWHRYDDR